MNDEVKKELAEGVETKERDHKFSMSYYVEYNETSLPSVDSYLIMLIDSMEHIFSDTPKLNQHLKEGLVFSNSLNDNYDNLLCTVKLEVVTPESSKKE